jgi:Sigma-70 region 2
MVQAAFIAPGARNDDADCRHSISVAAPTGFTLGTSSEFSCRPIDVIDSTLTLGLGRVMLTITEFSNNSVPSGLTAAESAGDSSDQALIRAIVGGDRRAMQVLYGRHHTRVYRFVLRLTKDPSLAEDLTSEAFFGIWRHAGPSRGSRKCPPGFLPSPATRRFQRASAA